MSGAVADPLSETFELVVDGETYVFRKPDIFHPIKLGYRAVEVRRKAYPTAAGGLDYGIDRDTVDFSRHCAVLELYLVRCDDTWPFSAGEEGKPVVDSSRFPADREETVWKIGAAFAEAVARFRARRNTAKPPAGDEAVGGQPNPG